MNGGVDDPRFIAAIDMIGRVGAKQFQVRWSGPDPEDKCDNCGAMAKQDEFPTVWMGAASFIQDGEEVWVASGGMSPLEAMLTLAEKLVDGGKCTHCLKPTGLDTNMIPESMPLNDYFCWFQFDPELNTFRRGCE